MKILWFCLLPLSLCAQWKEDFSMGHLQNWKGDTNSFTITQNKMLQLSANDSGDKFIYRETSENPDTEWALYFEMKFAPSATNKLRIYLSMDQIDPISSQAYYFEIGENGSNDNWKFYAQSTNKNILLGQGELSKLSSDPSRAYILATRTIDSSWIIKCDYTGNRNFSETIILKDSLYMKFPKSYFGLQCTYTSTRADKFIFDDISVDVPFIDKESPEIIGHSILNTKTIQINWNEKIDTTSAKTISNFQIQSIGNPVRIEIVSENQMNLEFPNQFVLSKNYILTYINVRDLSGNNITAEKQYKFDAVFDQFPEQGDIIISEIMADPDPAVALPAAEYVEIFNRSNKKINLEGLRISDGGNPSSPFKKEYLDPGEFMILCSAKDSLQFKPFGRTMGISSFPVLNNDYDQIILYSSNNNILDQLQYSITWHSVPQKSEGGYSLELFYPNQFCNQKKSWGTSNHASGGTPGTKNSIWNLEADNDKPRITSVIALSEWEISVVFNKTIDLTTMSSINNYSLKPGTSIANAEISDNKEEVVLLLNNPLIKGIKYTLNISTLKDCSGNISTNYEAEFEIPSEPQVGELLFNELLFNPRTGGVDYIELFNNSNKLLSTNGIFINNLIKDERWVNINVKTVIPAFSYLVLTSDPSNIIENYPLHDSSKIQEASMVSMDDDKGSLRLGIFKNGEITILDSVHYSDEWHNPLISDQSGISLEKIFTSLISNESRNWTSASSTFIYGSPGLKNSQFVDTNNVYHKEKPYTIESIVVSPNDDGKNDQLTIHLNLKKDGYKNRLRVFDLSGNEIADLNSVIVGTFDIIRWSGINKDIELAAPGNYIAVISFVHPDGESIEYKERFVLDY